MRAMILTTKGLRARPSRDMGSDDSKMYPFATQYDGDVHDALANMRRLERSIFPIRSMVPQPKSTFPLTKESASTGLRRPTLRRRCCACTST